MADLNAPFVAQATITATTFVVLQNIDEPAAGKLRSLVELDGNPSLHYWINVFGPGVAEYDGEWMDADVEAAVKAWFGAQA